MNTNKTTTSNQATNKQCYDPGADAYGVCHQYDRMLYGGEHPPLLFCYNLFYKTSKCFLYVGTLRQVCIKF